MKENVFNLIVGVVIFACAYVLLNLAFTWIGRADSKVYQNQSAKMEYCVAHGQDFGACYRSAYQSSTFGNP